MRIAILCKTVVTFQVLFFQLAVNTVYESWQYISIKWPLKLVPGMQNWPSCSWLGWPVHTCTVHAFSLCWLCLGACMLTAASVRCRARGRQPVTPASSERAMHDKSLLQTSLTLHCTTVTSHSRCFLNGLMPVQAYIHVYNTRLHLKKNTHTECIQMYMYMHSLWLLKVEWGSIHAWLVAIVGRTGRQPMDTVTPTPKWKGYAW